MMFDMFDDTLTNMPSPFAGSNPSHRCNPSMGAGFIQSGSLPAALLSRRKSWALYLLFFYFQMCLGRVVMRNCQCTELSREGVWKFEKDLAFAQHNLIFWIQWTFAAASFAPRWTVHLATKTARKIGHFLASPCHSKSKLSAERLCLQFWTPSSSRAIELVGQLA